jgi:hypothetical protein
VISGCAMAQAVNLRPFTAEACVRARVNRWDELAPASYSGGPRFKSRPGDRLP